MTKPILIDTCIVCGVEIIKANSRQMTCLSIQCQREWKSGTKSKVPKEKKIYTCLKCGCENDFGRICKKCKKENDKIHQWETW